MTIHAPYNFVTLSHFIYEPEDSDRISHDIPFSDGICGEFDIEITARTKLLVGGDRGERNEIQTVSPFKLPDGRHAIPESSLRGMIRNVLEIAAFGRMQMIDDKRFGIRDLVQSAKPFYGDRMTQRIGAAFKPRSRAGWLRLDKKDGQWTITECNFARIDHSDLKPLSPGFSRKLNDIKGAQSQQDRFARRLYGAWGSTSLKAEFWVGPETPHPHSVGQLLYSKAIPARPDGPPPKGLSSLKGTLVFTGQPVRWRREELTGERHVQRKKHMEFVFLASEKSKTYPISPTVWSDFLNIHESGEKPNDNWAFWKERFDTGKCHEIPVFFLINEAKDSTVLSVGLALMFKLAHELSVKEIVANTCEKHGQGELVDLPTALFGFAADNGKVGGLKSRVHLGVAKCVGEAKEIEEHATVLSGPKPSYFPAYIRQPLHEKKAWTLADSKSQSDPIYATYTVVGYEPEPELRGPEIRGWKRYPARGGEAAITEITDEKLKNNKDIQVILRPLDAGARFKSRVRFHNLRPFELGALLWALEWGDDSKLRHRLGMGKPFGFGEVSIAADETTWSLRPNDDARPVQKKADYITAFTEEMKSAYCEKVAKTPHGPQEVSWEKSEQITALLAMADPAKAADHDLTYMELQGFVDAKKAYKVLPYYTNLPPKGYRDHDLWPRRVPPPVPEPDRNGMRGARPPRQTGSGSSQESGLCVGDIVVNIEESDIQGEVIGIDRAFAEVRYADGSVDDRVPFRNLTKVNGGSKPF